MSGKRSYSNITSSQVYKAVTLGKNRRLTQSQSVAGFTPFVIERQTEDNLSQHIRGAARWNEVNNEEGYFVYDTLSLTYKEVEYESITRQWYFIAKDTRSRNWIAIQPVPQSLQLGRESIHHSTAQAADIDDDSSTGHTNKPSKLKDFLNPKMTTHTMTGTSMAAAALTLANTDVPTTTPIFRGFGSKVTGSKGGGPPPTGPFGPPGGGPPAGGHGAGGGAGGGPGGGGKLGGNPPPEFNGNRSYALTFMNKFNLYRLANMDAEQMTQPLKRAVLLLGFIKGPNINDWVQLRTDEMLD
jgi:hypothetical protein